MCKQFFDMYLLLLFARLYYSKSHTLPLETYMSSYFVTLDMHAGHVYLFPKTTVQCSHNFTYLVAFSNYLQCV